MSPRVFLTRQSSATTRTLKKGNLRTKAFDRWILVAPPEILNDFRRHLEHVLKDALAAEVAKDLTKIPTEKMADHLHDVLPI